MATSDAPCNFPDSDSATFVVRSLVCALTVFILSACAAGTESDDDGGQPLTPFASEIVAFVPGDGAGFGQDELPDIVLGAPHGGGESQGGRHVLSLGLGGSITLAFDRFCPDDDGPDLIVFENAFRFGAGVFSEPALVELSADGDDFYAFACAPDDDAPNGCAGMSPVFAGCSPEISPLDVDSAGGDNFDASLLSPPLAEFRFVRITDIAGVNGDDGASGFDLDAIACVHLGSQ